MDVEFDTELPSLGEEIANLSKTSAVAGNAWPAQYFSERNEGFFFFFTILFFIH